MKKIIILLSLSLIWSCQKTVNVTEVKNPDPRQMGGTDNAGGGNGVSGKPLESFIETNFIKTSAFVAAVIPIIEKLKEVDPKVAGDFYHLALNRDWYFVPVYLDMISGQIIGSYGRTDQLALQDLNKVWISTVFYKQMEERDQGALIVHELIMGMRLMQYQHRQDVCIAEASGTLLNGMNEFDIKKYQESKSFCRATYPKLVGSISGNFSLNSDDYDLIRKIVALILTQEKEKLEEAIILIKSSRLRVYNP